MSLGAFGRDGFGSSPYGSALAPFGVASASSLTANWVRVSFTALIDATFSPFTAPSNYSITPSLTVHAAIIESAQSVKLLTDPQLGITYTVTVDQARSLVGDSLDPRLKTATFDGLTPSAGFHAVATKVTRVRLVFDTTMRNDSYLKSPLSYEIWSLFGSSIGIDSVTVENLSNVRSVVLELSTPLQAESFYVVHIGPHVRTLLGMPVYPDTSIFQWVGGTGTIIVPMSLFSGELKGGLMGGHGGLVFFSPALEQAAADSIIEVDEVSVCTKAFDEYHIPRLPDPSVLYTFGSGTHSVLGQDAVLWAPRPRIVEAQVNLSDLRRDSTPTPVDSRCIATFTEPWDHTYISLLNNSAWKLFDNAGTPPTYFFTANNLAPIPPGPTTTRILEP